MNLRKGLVGHWTMDDLDSSNQELTDRSPYDYHGSINGPDTNQDGIIGESYNMSGSNGVNVGNPDQSLTEDLTISFWSKTIDSTNRDTIVDKAYGGEFTINAENGSSPSQFRLYHGDNGSNSSSYQSARFENVFAEDEWVHTAVVRDAEAKEYKLYVNNEPHSSNPETYDIEPTEGSNDIVLGKGYTGDGFTGYMSNVRIYNRALSDEEIGALYNVPPESPTQRSYIPNTYIEAFTETGSHTWNRPSDVRSVDVLVVGGGGGGGSYGAGGAGGVVYERSYPVNDDSLSATVGSGGDGGSHSNGEDSSFDDLIALGGGGGGSHSSSSPVQNGQPGGSGGGGGSYADGSVPDGGSELQPTSENGGLGSRGADSEEDHEGSGGGGAVSAGEPGISGASGDGGSGINLTDVLSAEYGSNGKFAGGGGGGSHSSGNAGSGKAGGGNGGTGSSGEGGVSNTGGGGGGGGNSSAVGGDGGSGIVIVKYRSQNPNEDAEKLY